MCCQAYLLPALSGSTAPSSTGGATPLRLPALTLRGSLHVVQDGSAFFPRAFGLVRRVVLFSNGINAWERLGQRAVRFFDQRGAGGKLLFTRRHGPQSLLHVLLDATQPHNAINASPPLPGRTARPARPCLAPQAGPTIPPR